MKGKTLSNLLLLSWCVMLMVACSREKPHYIIGVSQCSEDIWRNWQNAEMKMESNFHDGVELRFTTALDDSKRQIQQIDSLVESGIQLLIVAPNQRSSVKSAIDRAYDKGIPVIVFERKTDSQKYTAFVSADNYEMGRQMGEYVVSRLNGKGNIMEVEGLKGSSSAEERHKGFLETLTQYPEVKVVARLQGDWTEQTAYQAVKDYKVRSSRSDRQKCLSSVVLMAFLVRMAASAKSGTLCSTLPISIPHVAICFYSWLLISLKVNPMRKRPC